MSSQSAPEWAEEDLEEIEANNTELAESKVWPACMTYLSHLFSNYIFIMCQYIYNIYIVIVAATGATGELRPGYIYIYIYNVLIHIGPYILRPVLAPVSPLHSSKLTTSLARTSSGVGPIPTWSVHANN